MNYSSRDILGIIKTRPYCILVQMDDLGIDTGDLEKRLEEALSSVGTDHVTDNRPFWGMVSLVANYDNPTGVSLSPG